MEELYLVLYDIAEPKRLNKAAKIILDYGIRIQESLYEVRLTAQTLRALTARLTKIIDPEEDGVKIIPLCQDCAARRISAGAPLPQMEECLPWLVF